MNQDFTSIQRATAELVKRHVTRGDTDKAVRELDRALEVLPSSQKLPFLVERLHLLIRTRNDRRIGPAFRRLVAAARRARETGRVIDAHMETGDYLWAKGGKGERANGYQFYCAAMLEALPDVRVFSSISTHMTGRLLRIGPRSDGSELDRLERVTRAWIQEQTARNVEQMIPLAIWPLRLAARLNALPHSGRQSAEAIFAASHCGRA